MKDSIISEKSFYTFSEYSELLDVEEVLTYFGYSFQKQEYKLHRSSQKLERIDDLKSRLKESLPYISMNSETAKREFSIAPILMDLVYYTHAQLKVEFPLAVSNQLQGLVDYYFVSKNNYLIIEAREGDLERSFAQLAAELIALDKWLETETPQLYGAVTIGNVWQFGILERKNKLFIQDLNLWRVPADLEDLLRILTGILMD
jgi:hypothetical protein